MEAAEPGDAPPPPPARAAGSAQEQPREAARLFGHREVPQPAEHGPDLRRGHGPPTRAEEIPYVVAVVVSRSSTVRREKNKGESAESHPFMSLGWEEGRWETEARPRSALFYLILFVSNV